MQVYFQKSQETSLSVEVEAISVKLEPKYRPVHVKDQTKNRQQSKFKHNYSRNY